MQEFQDLFDKADNAGNTAVAELKVTPMLVGSATSIFSNKIDYTKPTYVIADGPCGFASIQIKPATTKFAKWLVANSHARRDTYEGGIYIHVGQFNQSHQKKTAYAQAFAEVLRAAGYKSYAKSRLD